MTGDDHKRAVFLAAAAKMAAIKGKQVELEHIARAYAYAISRWKKRRMKRRETRQ